VQNQIDLCPHFQHEKRSRLSFLSAKAERVKSLEGEKWGKRNNNGDLPIMEASVSILIKGKDGRR
jgi:hypothetical protein